MQRKQCVVLDSVALTPVMELHTRRNSWRQCLTFTIASASAVAVAWAAWRYFSQRKADLGCTPIQSSDTEDTTLTHSLPNPSAYVTDLPFLGLRVTDKEFATSWVLSRNGVWYDFCEGELQDVSPSAVAEYVLLSHPDRPQINIVAEDLLVSMTAAEYVERSRQGLPTMELDTSTMNSILAQVCCKRSSASEPAALNEQMAGAGEDKPVTRGGVSQAMHHVDVCCCAFTEEFDVSGYSHLRTVINVVAVQFGVAVIMQLLCRDDVELRERLLPVFQRVCRSTIAQLSSPDSHITRRHETNRVQFALPATRQDVPGVVMTLTVGRLQLMSNSHPIAQLIYEKLHKASSSHSSHSSRSAVHSSPPSTQSGSGRTNMIACVEKRTHGNAETVETYLVQLHSKSLFERVVQDAPLQPLELGRPSALRWRNDLLCFVVAVGGTQAAAEEHAQLVCDTLRPFHGHKRVTQFLHAPSGISYALPAITTNDGGALPTFLTHYFGAFDFQVFPNGVSSERSSLRLAVRPISTGDSFAQLQRAATKVYDERFVTRRPSVEGWCRMEVATESPEGRPLMEHVTMLEHRSWFVHIVWTCPRAQSAAAITEDVRRSLHFHSV